MPPFRRALILALFLISLGGAMLHTRIHPVYKPVAHQGAMAAGTQETEFEFENLVAISLCVLDVVVVTALFCFAGTAPAAYLLNGMICIFGTVFMAHFGIADVLQKFREPTLMDWILRTTLSDIVVLWADFFIGKAIYDSYSLGATEPVVERTV